MHAGADPVLPPALLTTRMMLASFNSAQLGHERNRRRATYLADTTVAGCLALWHASAMLMPLGNVWDRTNKQLAVTFAVFVRPSTGVMSLGGEAGCVTDGGSKVIGFYASQVVSANDEPKAFYPRAPRAQRHKGAAHRHLPRHGPGAGIVPGAGLVRYV